VSQIKKEGAASFLFLEKENLRRSCRDFGKPMEIWKKSTLNPGGTKAGFAQTC